MSRYQSPFSPSQIPGGILWVNAYRMGKTWGGPEEGGWWKDVYELLCSVPVPAKRVPKDHAFEHDQRCYACGKDHKDVDHKWNNPPGENASKPEHYPKCYFEPRYNCAHCGLVEDEDGVKRGVNEDEHYDLEPMTLDEVQTMIAGAHFDEKRAVMAFTDETAKRHLEWLLDDVNDGDPNSVLDGSRLVIRVENSPGESYVYPDHYE